MSSAQDIIPRVDKVSRSVSNSWSHAQNLSLSSSPTLAFHNSPNDGRSGSFGGGVQGGIAGLSRTKTLKPFATQDIKVLLLENVNQTGQDILNEQGYQVEVLKTSLSEDALIEKIR
jgi:D-3-phosphoglycerate dehydrogenase